MDLVFDGDTRNWRGFQELGAETELLMVPEEGDLAGAVWLRTYSHRNFVKLGLFKEVQ